VVEQRVGSHLSTAGFPGKALASAVSSSGLRPAAGRPALAHAADAAFVSGLRLVFLIGSAVVLAGSLAAAVLGRRRVEAPEPVLEVASWPSSERPRVESNHRTQLRRLPLCPLSYGAWEESSAQFSVRKTRSQFSPSTLRTSASAQPALEQPLGQVRQVTLAR